MNKENFTQFIKQTALEEGFEMCGVAKAGYLEEEANHLEQWLSKGYHGKMSYMENHFDVRLDPSKLVDNAKSVIVLLSNYFTEEDLSKGDNFKIAKYAYGRDYHKVIKKKMKNLIRSMRSIHSSFAARAFVDSAPILERVWAKKAGLGWAGKNTLLLNKKLGSYYFLSEIVIDVELEYDQPTADHCGTCTACLDACPTQAFPAPGILDSNKCISYLTIELKDQIPNEFKGQYNDWIFGCDICQEVCPWNKFSKNHKEDDFNPKPELRELKRADWVEVTEEIFSKVFEGSPLKRAGYEGLKKNINFLRER